MSRAQSTQQLWTPPPLMRLGAFELADRVARGEVSALDLINLHVERIEQVNPRLNALVAQRFDAARAEAAAADARIARGERAPLLGVPFTVKEMISVAGMPHTLGALARRDNVAAQDATVVARLRAAGAIPLGVSNVPEWGMWYETYNLIWGRTNNPYDPRRIAGGSSGGEGALVGAGAAPFGLGSDIGGSIRIPAAFCGVFGHKPTPGWIPLTGHYPVYASGPEAHQFNRTPYVAVGPIARSARDLWPLLQLMSGADAADPNLETVPLRERGDIAQWKGRRVVVFDAPRLQWARLPDPSMREAVRRAASVLEDRGARLVEGRGSLFERSLDVWFAALQDVGSPAFAESVGEGTRVSLARELLRLLTRRPRYSLPALLFVAGEIIGHMPPAKLARALDRLASAREELTSLLGDDGVLILPPHPRTAPRHDAPLLRPFDFAYTAFFNALRVPATVAPAGLDEQGMPLSVQIVSRAGNDALTVEAACILEEGLGGWTPPGR